jgi:hypothetical protein
VFTGGAVCTGHALKRHCLPDENTPHSPPLKAYHLSRGITVAQRRQVKDEPVTELAKGYFSASGEQRPWRLPVAGSFSLPA